MMLLSEHYHLMVSQWNATGEVGEGLELTGGQRTL